MTEFAKLIHQTADVREVFDRVLYDARQPIREMLRTVNARLSQLEQKLATVTGADPNRFIYPTMPLRHARRRMDRRPPAPPAVMHTEAEVEAHMHDMLERDLAGLTDDAGRVLIPAALHRQMLTAAFKLGVQAGRKGLPA